MARRSRTGFSLTELLVVVAVILILLALLVVGIETTYTSAVQLKCQHRLEQIGSACLMYASANHGALPEAFQQSLGRPWYQVLAESGCLATLDVVVCPATDAPPPQLVRQEPSTEASSSILEALRWLKRNQNPSTGGWSGVGPDGSKNKNAHNAVSGLAMLLFLTSGCTDTGPPEFASTVTRGLQYLVSECDNGAFRRNGNLCMYSQGICMMAMGEAVRRVEHPNLAQAVRAAAQEGIEFLCRKQSSTDGGFSYGGAGRDMSVTGWDLQAIAAALDAGLDVPASSGVSGSKTQAFMDRSILVDGYRCHRVKCAYNSSYYKNQSHAWYCEYEGATFPSFSDWKARVIDKTIKCPGQRPFDGDIACNRAALRHCWAGAESQLVGGKCPKCGSDTSHDYPALYGTGYQYTGYSNPSVRLTAAALVGRRLLGRSASASDCQGQLQWIIDWRYGVKDYVGYYAAGSDLYTLYYVTLALELMGGSRWPSWQSAFQGPLMARQVTDGEHKGSWPDNISYGPYAGRVFTTALAGLTLGHTVEHNWAQQLAVGECTYGYNNRMGKTRRTPAADTIMVMDYAHWEIDRDDLNVELNDDERDIAPRHGGRANALLGDGSVRAFRPEEITDSMWTLEPDD